MVSGKAEVKGRKERRGGKSVERIRWKGGREGGKNEEEGGHWKG
jgi:hypothetical protein